MKTKRFLSLLLSIVIILSVANVSVFADATDGITVNVSIAQNGKFVSGKDDTKLAYTPITVTDANKNGSYDIDDVLYAAHELYFDGGAVNGYASAETAHGLSLAKLWGDSSFNFGYYVNNQSAWSLRDEVSNGDNVYAFIYQDTMSFSDAYTFFDSNTSKLNGGEALTLTLNKSNYGTDPSPIPNATITVNEVTTPYQTDENGDVELYFAKEGTYIVSATPEKGYIVPPVCVVSVTIDDADAETTVLSDKEALTLDETVTADLTLPTLGESKRTFISWSTSVDSIISADGKVTRSDEDKTVILTATLKHGDYSDTKDFYVIVKAITNEEIEAEQAKIQAVADALTFDVIKNQNTQAFAVTTQLNLWRSSDYKDGQLEWSKSANVLTGYIIDWTYTDNVKEYGYIECGAEAVNVNLTAIVYSADKSAYTTPVNVIIPITIPSFENAEYLGKVNDVLEKISATYKNNTDEWTVMDMGAYENYAPQTENKLTYEARQKYINNAIATIKNSTSDTDIDKAVLGLFAIGKNPELLYSVNNNTAFSAIEKLNGVTQSTSAWSAPYTLAAYNQADYDTDFYETKLVNALLAAQKEDGSWDEWGTIDTTANVIAGLSFYKENQEVKTAIANAVSYLSTQQNADGTYSDYYNGENSNSTAMVVIGLAATGVDLVKDTRFIKNEKTIIDGLLSFLVEDGDGFGYTDNSSINSYSTEQAFRALIAFAQTMKMGDAYNVYDFSENELTPARATSNNSSSSAPSDPSGDNITVTMTIKADTGYWLKNYRVSLPGEDAKVYHAFVKACSENSITYKGADNGYVSSITKGNITLAEFGKGENSGWLYKVNGELPTVGLTDFSISDGDDIVWYYTEDWTKDPSAGHYIRPANKDEDKNTENEDEDKTETKIEIKTETAISGDTANVTTSEKNIINAITEAEKDNASVIIISSGDTKNATNIILEIPANSVKEIAESKGLALSVETSKGNVGISNEVLNAISDQIGDKPLDIVIKTKLADEITVGADVISNNELQNAIIVDVAITSGDTSICTFSGHSLCVDVPVEGTKHEKGKNYKVYIISSDGGVETTYGECVEKNGQLYVSVQTKHLSSFVVTAIEKAPFTDTVDHWASDAIEYAYNHSIMQGVSETEFAPDNTMTRAMLVTVLYRLENPTEKAKSHSFTDVKDGAWYADAVSWAAENGIVKGISETEFAPNEDITREQMAAVLYRYAQYKEQDTSIGENTNILSYTDAMEISEYAIPAMQWMIGAGIMKGETEFTVNPKNVSTRAQVATILMRYLEL